MVVPVVTAVVEQELRFLLSDRIYCCVHTSMLRVHYLFESRVVVG